MKILGCIWILMVAMSVSAFAGPTLDLGPASVHGTTLSFPVLLANVQGTSISGIDAYVKFDPDVFALKMNGDTPVSATAGAATTAAGKQIRQSGPGEGVLRILIISLGNTTPIADGVVAQVSFDIISAAKPSNETFSIVPSASGSDASDVFITGSGTTAPGSHQLSVTLSGNGGGNVNSNPAGIACSGGVCSANFFAGSSVTLMPTAATSSSFGAWSGACAGSGTCIATMNSDLSATATFVMNNPVLVGSNFFGTLNDAYSNSPDNAVIQAVGMTFFEELDLGRVIAVTLQGGCDSSFENCIGYTTIDGTVSVSKGSLVAERLILM